MTTELTMRHFTHDDLPQIRQLLIDLGTEASPDTMDTPFRQRFPWFVDHWGRNPGFACVIGYDSDEPVGFAYGAPASPNREWWREHLNPAPERSRTFSVSELRIRPEWRKTGASKLIHEALLAARPEDLAVLLVDVLHPKVQALYESWSYRRVGESQPLPDSPRYAVMLADLPLLAS